MLAQITPIISTYNEAANIARVLQALDWANEVLVIDSFSTDDTLDICAEYENVRVIQNTYTGPTDQSNFGLQQAINTEWVMSMDSDYIVTPELRAEIAELSPSQDVKGFEIGFEYLIDGRALKGSLYPPRISLYRRASAHYQRDGHTQRVVIDGLVLTLKHKMLHDDRKPYHRWLASQRRYASQEALKLAGADWRSLSWPDRVRVSGLAPLAVIPYTLFAKGLVFSGWAGLKYTWQRLIAEIYLQVARFKLKFGFTQS